MVLISDIARSARSTIRKHGFNEEMAEELAGDVLLIMLEKVRFENGYIDESMEVRNTEIYYTALKQISRGKAVKEHNRNEENMYCHNGTRNTEEEDELEVCWDIKSGEVFGRTYGDGCDWFNAILEGQEEQEKSSELDILTLLLECFGEKNRTLLELYVSWLGKGNAFSRKSLCNFLGISKQAIAKRLKCLNEEDVKRIIQLATKPTGLC